MGATKYEIYPSEIVEFTEIIKAIAHPARMQAVMIVAENTDEDVTTAEFKEKIKLSQSTLSQHLKVLVGSGILKTRVITKSNKSCLSYCVEREALTVITEVLKKLLKQVDIRSDSQYAVIEKYYSRFRMYTDWRGYFQT